MSLIRPPCSAVRSSLSHALQSLSRRLRGWSRHRRLAEAATFRPRLEGLEDRTVFSVRPLSAAAILSGAAAQQGLVTTAPASVAVFNPEVVGAGLMVQPVEGAAFNGLAVAAFTDPAGAQSAGAFSATIDWGDGTPTNPDVTTGAVSGPDANGVFHVSGSHAYAEEGVYRVTVVVHRAQGPDSTLVGEADVSDPAVNAAGGFAFTPTQGVDTGPLMLATFTDPGGAEAAANYTALINWGDGQPADTATLANGGIVDLGATNGVEVFAVQGRHTYTAPGDFTIGVLIAHDQAPPAAVDDVAHVVSPTAVASATASAAASLNANGLLFLTASSPPASPSSTAVSALATTLVSASGTTPVTPLTPGIGAPPLVFPTLIGGGTTTYPNGQTDPDAPPTEGGDTANTSPGQTGPNAPPAEGGDTENTAPSWFERIFGGLGPANPVPDVPSPDQKANDGAAKPAGGNPVVTPPPLLVGADAMSPGPSGSPAEPFLQPGLPFLHGMIGRLTDEHLAALAARPADAGPGAWDESAMGNASSALLAAAVACASLDGAPPLGWAAYNPGARDEAATRDQPAN